jgi:hypothetical protein
MGSGQAVARDREEGSMNQSTVRQKIVECLKCVPATTRQLIDRTMIPKGYICHGVQMLKGLEVIRIKQYVKDGQNRNTAVYELTGKEIPELENYPPYVERHIESDRQAEAFAAAMRGQRYDSVRERSAIARFDLARVDAPTWSSLA